MRGICGRYWRPDNTCGPPLVIAFAICVPLATFAGTQSGKFVSDGRKVAYEEFRGGRLPARTLILLPGASGPNAPFYRHQAAYFAGHGCRVLLLHYFDATNGVAPPTGSSYRLWSRAVIKLIAIVQESSGNQIGLLGYSLGASIALAAASQNVNVAAIAEWYGSLPDEFLPGLRRLPPLLILHGAQDNIIPVINAQQLEKLCTMRDFVCASHTYADQAHGFSGRALADADERTVEFLKKYVP